MNYEIEYFHPRILKQIEAWPESIKGISKKSNTPLKIT
jgi:hypothetical protein